MPLERPAHPFFVAVPVSTYRLAMLLALGMTLLMLSDLIGRMVPWIPSVLWLTTLALLAGHLPPGRSLKTGSSQMGYVALHAFFVVIGINSRFADIAAVGFAIFACTGLVVAIHGLLLYGLGWLVRLDLGTLSVASQAAIGGPSSALAVAVGRQWHGLVLPGVVVGLLGYAVGNYLGLAVAHLVRKLLLP